MYKIGVIGDRESVLGFKAVGLSVFPCEEPEEAGRILKEIAEKEFAIIYITEQLYQHLGDFFAQGHFGTPLCGAGEDSACGRNHQGHRQNRRQQRGKELLHGATS